MIALKKHPATFIGLIGGIILVLAMTWGITRFFPPPVSETLQAHREAARKEGYDQGYAAGYDAAKKENDTLYQKGYNAARKDIGRGTLTTYGIIGFLVGLTAGLGGVAALNRKTLAVRIKTLRKHYELKKAFDSMPDNLPPDVAATAEQIARAYANIMEQFRSTKGYTVDQYITRWRPKLKEMMGKAVRLMELIQELETAQAHVDAQKLERIVTGLRDTMRRARDDDARNEAAKSLRRTRQAQNDLEQTHRNLEHCKTALQGITGVLESMHLKMSNIKVNAQKTDLLDELSSDLETEMAALEEALAEFPA